MTYYYNHATRQSEWARPLTSLPFKLATLQQCLSAPKIGLGSGESSQDEDERDCVQVGVAVPCFAVLFTVVQDFMLEENKRGLVVIASYPHFNTIGSICAPRTGPIIGQGDSHEEDDQARRREGPGGWRQTPWYSKKTMRIR